METNNNQSSEQIKKLGKTEGVIYMDGENSNVTAPANNEQVQQEQTKGVQTYIPMSMYRRLNDIKLTRRENIAALVAQAIALWLDVQEGKQKVEKL